MAANTNIVALMGHLPPKLSYLSIQQVDYICINSLLSSDK